MPTSEAGGYDNGRSYTRYSAAMAASYVLDTNVFNMLFARTLTLAELPQDGTFLITHVQKNELERTPDESDKAGLLKVLTEVGPSRVPTESMVWGLFTWGEAKWSDGVLYERAKLALDAWKVKANNPADALIAEVCIVNGYTLITTDKALAAVVRDLAGHVRYFPWRAGARPAST